jgi:hypothetical protein
LAEILVKERERVRMFEKRALRGVLGLKTETGEMCIYRSFTICTLTTLCLLNGFVNKLKVYN